MEAQLRFTGVGGQGVLLAGEILAEAKIVSGGYGTKTSTSHFASAWRAH